MFEHLKRLGRTGAAYTASSIVAKLFAVALLPVYTRYLSRADYGAAEVLLASVVMGSIFVRLGIVEALLRFYYRYDDRAERRRVVRTTWTFLLVTSTAGALVAAAFSQQLAELILDRPDRTLTLIAIYGLWVFTNYELLLALFRLDERARDYFVASMANVLLTIAFTVFLVVVEGQKARGLLGGNFLGSTVLMVALLYVQRGWIGFSVDRALLRPMLRFGLPTMPAEISLYSLNFIDRIALVRLQGLGEAGLYSLAFKFSQVMIVVVRAFQLAWPPLAYSIRDDEEARRVYAYIVSYYLMLSAWIVLGLTLLGRWLLRLLTTPEFYGANEAIPFVSAGAALYGLYLVLVVVLGRAGRTEFNFPVALAATGLNLALNLVLIPPYGIRGAGAALVVSYVLMLALMHLTARRFFPIPFQWSRMARIVALAAGLGAVGELFVPAGGAAGFVLRVGLLALFPPLLYATGFFHHAEVERLRGLLQALKDGVALRRGPQLVEELDEREPGE